MNSDALGQRPITSIEQDMISQSSSQTPQGTSAWSHPPNMGSFEFTPTSNDISVPTFDPAIAAFADMSFAQPGGGYHSRDMHDKKRMKVETDTPALDSIDYWIQFDDDADKMGSFEVDYSRRADGNQNRVGMSADSLPGLGSGLYSTTMAPFREDDFIDDSAFEQTFSEDEEMFESSTDIGKQTSQMDDFQSSQADSEQTDRVMGTYGSPQGMDKFQPGLRLASSGLKDVPRQMRRDLWSDRGQQQNLDSDEQRRLLEAAMDPGNMPGTMIPPNGFGVGFGAGLGVAPQEFENTPASTSSQQTKSAATGKSRRASDTSDNSEAKKQTRRSSTATKTSVATGTSKKSPSTGPAPKARSADRIAHNDVERKYRTNLKDKIAELRAAVPALQGVGGDVESEGGTVTPNQQASKVSKGTVLTKATEYIHHLEARNRAMAQEHQQLARRLQAFETLLNGQRHPEMMMQPNHSMQLFDPRGFC